MKTFVICSVLLALVAFVQSVPLDGDGVANDLAGEVFIVPQKMMVASDGPDRSIGVGFCVLWMCQNTCVSLGFKIGICSSNGATCTCFR